MRWSQPDRSGKMRISNIRVPHLGQDGQAMTRGVNPISAICASHAAWLSAAPKISCRWSDTLTFRWLPLNDIVHRIQTASEMGFNRRKLEDQRRETAAKEAASRRATDVQVLEDAERLIAAWNERQGRRMPMLFSPTIGARPLQRSIGSCGYAVLHAERSIQ